MTLSTLYSDLPDELYNIVMEKMENYYTTKIFILMKYIPTLS
jgi:hypothetical protein